MQIRTDITQETACLRQASSLSLRTSSSPAGDDLSAFKYIRPETDRQDLLAVHHQVVKDDHLGITTRLASTPTITGTSDNRWMLHARIRSLMQGTKHDRVSSCMQARGASVDLMQSGDGYYYTGVMACGSVWSCPICRQKILAGRRDDISQALESGLTPVMVTVTLQHTRQDSLTVLMDALNKALRRLKSGRWYQDFKSRYGVVASVTTLEIRWSRSSGWHPHKHMILFCDVDQVTDDDADLIQRDLTGRYAHLLSLSGHYASQYHGIDVRVGDDAVGDYLTKDTWTLAHEMSSTDTKNSDFSLSPFNLAYMATEGDGHAWHLWMEYIKSTHGKRQISWSRGGKDLLGVTDLSDEDLASSPDVDPEEDPVIVMSIHRDLWHIILDQGKAGILLDVARQGGQDAVRDWLDDLQRWIQTTRGHPGGSCA